MAAGVGVNRYAYAGNSPVLYLDPSGLEFGDSHSRGYRSKPDTQRRGYRGTPEVPLPSLRGRYQRNLAFVRNAHAGNVAASVTNVSEDGTRYGSKFPGGAQGPFVSYDNNDETKPTTNQVMPEKTYRTIERLARLTDNLQMNVNSTRRPVDPKTPGSNHPKGRAADFNEFNGKRIKDHLDEDGNITDPALAEDVRELQEIARFDPAVRENYGPYTNERYDRNFSEFDSSIPGSGVTQTTNTTTSFSQTLIDNHRNHVHVGILP